MLQGMQRIPPDAVAVAAEDAAPPPNAAAVAAEDPTAAWFQLLSFSVSFSFFLVHEF